MKDKNIILFGGDGFIGKGLLDKFISENIEYVSIDKKDYDLSDYNNIDKCINDLKNKTHIVILASKIGANLFNSEKAKYASEYNKKIGNLIISAIQLASKKFKKSYNITYYSTSEIFGNMKDKNDFISNNSPYNFSFKYDRYLYSFVKYQEELRLFLIFKNTSDIISAIKIARPFNIFGRNLKRGVVFQMIKTALLEKKIYYSNDTTRTMTNIDFASDKAFDLILSKDTGLLNLADDRCSMTMEILANIIKLSLNLNIEFVLMRSDPIILFRNTSKINTDINYLKSIMESHIIDLAKLIENEI